MVMAMANLAMATGNIGALELVSTRSVDKITFKAHVIWVPFHELPGYRAVMDDGVRSHPDRHWGVTIHDEPGYRIPNMLDAAVAGTFKGYIFKRDMLNPIPTRNMLRQRQQMDCVIVQDLFERNSKICSRLPSWNVFP